MKMKKNAIALSVAALVAGLGLAGTASADVLPTANTTALQVSAGGVGHSLLMPYFTVQGGNVTLLNIVNSDTVNGKAVKVRVRGASNSDDVMDFQLFLSPGDVWTANLSAGTDGVTRISTADKSCTQPESIRTTGNAVVLDRLPTFLNATDQAAQAREGYIEIFNMADIRPRTVTDPVTGVPNSLNSALYTAIKHVGGVAPCSSGIFSTLAATNLTGITQANNLGLFPPSSGLFGNYMYVNQTTGAVTSFSNEMTAVRAVGSPPGQTPVGNIVFFPQTGDPLPNPSAVTADPLLVGGTIINPILGGPDTISTGPTIQAVMFDAPDMSTPYLNVVPPTGTLGPAFQADDLSRSLATLSIRNEFLTNAGISAASDWSFSSPTRRYHIAMAYGSSAASSYRVRSLLPNNFYDFGNTSVDVVLGVPQICVGTGPGQESLASDLTFYDQEENSPGTSVVISPGKQKTLKFCGESSVLSFNLGEAATRSGVLRAQITRKDLTVPGTPPFAAGWLTIRTPGLTGLGLPVLGKYFLQASNPSTPAGFSANFGVSFEHRYQRTQ